MSDILQINEFHNINIYNESHQRLLLCIILFIFILYSYNTKYDYIQIFLGAIISYYLYSIFGAKKTGENVPLMLKYNNFHIHHWIYFTLLLIIILQYNKTYISSFIIGLLFGGICHGIQYKDWNIIFF
jgi:hypothetical protein